MGVLKAVAVTSTVVVALAVLFTLDCMTEYTNQLIRIADPFFNFYNSSPPATNVRILTKEELKQYDGLKGSKGLYLGILGKVFDVSKGVRHYGPGGGYHFFVGKESRAYC